ncbi:MAG: endo-1,4-beta-xylanase [Clostridia bacterium]|nr:endo-1,4-beta-xylanase [Clostridia bacterium]
MKKIRTAILIGIIMALMMPSAWAENPMIYQSIFSWDTDGWYARSAGDAQISLTQDRALHIEGRNANWNSPGRDFILTPGYAYELSVQVRQSDMESADFMISVAHSLDGTESYENLANGTVKKDAWTTLEGTYTAGFFDRFVLYVETVNAPELSFDIRFFRIRAPEGTPSVLEEKEAEETGSLPSLREVYADKFMFGTAAPQYAFSNTKLTELMKTQFNIITPENELKPDAVLDVAASKKMAAEDEKAVAVHFSSAQKLLDFAQENGIKVHGHVLVWHSQTPEAFFHESYDPAKPLVSREVMLGRMENYIRQVMEYMDENYPGVIVSWDVVNEAIDDGTNKLRSSNWMKTIGEDFVARAFEYARKYAPQGTLLYYNDYNTAYAGKLNGIYQLLASLMEEGNLDGYGFQMHHSVSQPTMQQITASVEKIASLGIRLRVSELDIGIDSESEENLQKQAQKYAQIMLLLNRFRDQVEAVQVWGITDNMSWRSKNSPLLFDKAMQPKPAFWAVADPTSVH